MTTPRDVIKARAEAALEQPFVPDDVKPEHGTVNALTYIAGQSFHIRRALERIAIALETAHAIKR